MKGKIITESEDKKFKSFKVELEIDSVEEARLLFHVLNSIRLGELIKSYSYNKTTWGYADEIANQFTDEPNLEPLYSKIEKYIKSQGYEL